MYLLFIRHLESEKNLKQSFASFDDQEPLTQKGIEQGLELAGQIAKFIKDKNLKVKQIYSATSRRATQTAELISQRLNLPIKTYESLCSSKTGVLQGKSEEEVKKERPEFIQQLQLYRKGIVSSYDFEIIEGKESKKSLEKRVNKTLNEIKNIPDEDLKIIVFHRSSLTAAIIQYARENYHYPKDFYGFIKLDYGHITLLTDQDKNRKWTFLCVNENINDLNKFMAS